MMNTRNPNQISIKHREINEYDLLKAYTIILVVLAHVTWMYSGKGAISIPENQILTWLSSYIYSFHMPLFVFISGGIYYIGKRIRKKYNNRKSFIINKAKRLLIPYFVFSLLLVFPVMIYIGNVNLPYIKYILLSYFLSLDPRHLWYVAMLFGIFIVYDLFEKIIYNHPYLSTLLFLSLNICSSFIPGVFQIHNITKFMLFFHLGYIYESKKQTLIIINKCKTGGVIFGLLSFSLWFISISTNEQINSIFYKNMLSAMTAIAGIAFMVLFCIIIKRKNLQIIRILSKDSYGIYLFHPMIIYVLFFHLKDYSISPFWVTLIVFTVSFLFSYLLTQVIRKLRLQIIIGES